LADEMEAPAASRVLSRSPFGYSHEPAGLAALGFVAVLPLAVLPLAVLPLAVLPLAVLVLVLVQPARTTPTARIRLGHTIFPVPIAHSQPAEPSPPTKI